jgi:hypothetical protein
MLEWISRRGSELMGRETRIEFAYFFSRIIPCNLDAPVDRLGPAARDDALPARAVLA